jgi:hypothetical protein
MVLLAGCDDKSEAISQWEIRQNWPAAVCKKVAISTTYLKALHFCIYLLKVKEHWKLVKPRAGSSPIFALSSHTTFSLTQTGATTPFNIIPSLLARKQS